MKRTIAMRGILLTTLALTATLGAEQKPPISPADYGPFETLQSVPLRGGLSPDGRWLAFGVNRANGDNELRIVSVADGTTKVAAFGAQPVFSANSRFVAYSIGVSEAQDEKLKKEKKPLHKKLGLLSLQTGETTTIDEVETFSFDASGESLAMRRYGPEPEKKTSADAVPSPEPESATAGATLMVRRLAVGQDTTFGNVAEFAWQDKGRLLALTISTPDKVGNGIQVFDPQTGALRTLDSSLSIYTGAAWRKNADDLAVLRSKTDARHDGPIFCGLAWTGLASGSELKHLYDPTADDRFPAGLRVVSFRKPSWSENGQTVWLGVAKWLEVPSAAPARTSAGQEGHDALHSEAAPEQTAAPVTEAEEPASVDVWHSHDIDVMPKQKVQAKADRERSMLAAWHVASGRLVQLGKHLMEQVTPVKHQRYALAADWAAYAMERTIGRPAADLYRVDEETGDRTSLKERVNDRYVQLSPGGRYLLLQADNHYWTVDLASRGMTNITRNIATTFVNRESDATVAQKPPFGVAGWTRNDESVILYDKFDLWRVTPDGTRATRLTNGAPEQVRYRYVRLSPDPDDEAINPDEPMLLSMFGIWTKKSGYAKLSLGTPAVERLLFLDKSVTRLAKAKDANVYTYVVEAYDDSPGLFVGGADLAQAKQVTKTNTFQEKYAWGHGEIVEYRNDRGERLQGALYYPAQYEPGRRYPLVVHLYERLSDQLHRYISPSDRAESNTAVFSSRGYFVLEPDIAFRPREPGQSVAECVTAAIRQVVRMGVIDPRRIGVIGHSWGGFDASFLATHTDLFAAAVAGAPITDLISNYGSHHWGPGIAETDHIETGQQRMEVPLWEDLPAYIRNSALFNVQNMKTPLLIEVGDSDGTVFWHQGVELYNVARRARKDVVMLAYAGEDHGLRKKANQLDYHRRIIEWFGHYLKDEPAADWIANGVSYLAREQELKAAKARKGHE